MNDETKPRSVATINPTGSQMIPRHVGRIKTLRAWLADAEALAGTDRAKNPEKVQSMQAELDRRQGELAAAVGEVQEALAD